MTTRHTRLLDLFVEPRSAADSLAEHDTVPAPAVAPLRAAESEATPVVRRNRSVAVLAGPGRAAHATAGIALALARACGSRCAVMRLLGAPAPSATSSPLPAARRAAARLRRGGHAAVAVGRLVWLSEPVAPDADAHALASAELLRLADAVGAPAALGVALSRTTELDRAVGSYDGLVVTRASDAAQELDDLVLRSLRTLGPPVVALSALGRVAGTLAASGLHVPAAALTATRELFGAGA